MRRKLRPPRRARATAGDSAWVVGVDLQRLEEARDHVVGADGRRQLDEFAVYNRVLTPQEVSAHFAMGTGVAWIYSVVGTIWPALFPVSMRGHDGSVAIYFEAAAVITAPPRAREKPMEPPTAPRSRRCTASSS